MKLFKLLLDIFTNLKKLFCNFFTTNNNKNVADKNSENNNDSKYKFIISNEDNKVIVKSYEKISSFKSRFSETKVAKVMDGEEFRIRGKELIDYMVDFRNGIKNRPVFPSVEPNYLKPLLPSEAPEYPEKFENVLNDFETKIAKGNVFWGHPRFHAYFPAGDSYPSIMGDMLNGILGVIGFSWRSGPSCTELEIIVMDWFAKAMDLPKKFLSDGKKGTGVLQGSASDCVMNVFLAARYTAIQALKKENGFDEDDKEADFIFLPKLVAYTSQESHSCVEKAAKLCMVRLRILKVTDEGNVSAETLEKAMAEDEAKGLKPFLYSGIFGSTSLTAFDNLMELGPVCKKRPDYFWIHVDAAYAGNCFICPEMRYLMKGLEYANSFNVNPNKWLLTLFDCSCLWVDDQIKFTKGLVVDPYYLQHDDIGIIDRRHFHIALSRRFRSLKLWLVFRLIGIKHLQEYIRNHIGLAKYFESLVRQDDRFGISNIVRLGLVCFHLKAGNHATKELLTKINVSKELHITPARDIQDRTIIRFTVDYEHATQEDMDIAWRIIKKYAEIVLNPPIITDETSPRKKALLQRRLSFTRSISKEQFEKRSSSLYDGATPILVVEEDCEEQNVFDDVFANAIPEIKTEEQNSEGIVQNGLSETTE